MKNLLKKYREELSQAVLDVIWQAWSQAGVLGDMRVSAAGRIVDPEPLLLLTWECARQDPRVFDEVLDWLVRNGKWVNVVRLSTLLNEDQVCVPSAAEAVAAIMCSTIRDQSGGGLRNGITPRSFHRRPRSSNGTANRWRLWPRSGMKHLPGLPLSVRPGSSELLEKLKRLTQGKASV